MAILLGWGLRFSSLAWQKPPFSCFSSWPSCWVGGCGFLHWLGKSRHFHAFLHGHLVGLGVAVFFIGLAKAAIFMLFFMAILLGWGLRFSSLAWQQPPFSCFSSWPSCWVGGCGFLHWLGNSRHFHAFLHGHLVGLGVAVFFIGLATAAIFMLFFMAILLGWGLR